MRTQFSDGSSNVLVEKGEGSVCRVHPYQNTNLKMIISTPRRESIGSKILRLGWGMGEGSSSPWEKKESEIYDRVGHIPRHFRICYPSHPHSRRTGTRPMEGGWEGGRETNRSRENGRGYHCGGARGFIVASLALARQPATGRHCAVATTAATVEEGRHCKTLSFIFRVCGEGLEAS